VPIAVATGVVGFIALRFSQPSPRNIYFGCCFDPQSAPPVWYVMLSSPLGAAAGLLPGFIAGWLYPRSGIAVGFLVGLLGNAIYSALFLTMWPTVIEGGFLLVVEMVFRLLFLASSWALGSAAAGGTAQLLRSSKPFQPIEREDARSLKCGV
jgi:hypothetical protein